MRRSAGFTVVELLIAAAVLMVLLGSLVGIFVSTRQAYETNREVSAASSQVRSAIAAMRYDIGLAGYCPDPDTCGLVGDSLEIVLDDGRGIVAITSRYEETRFTGGSNQVQSITYSVEDDHLVRTVDSNSSIVADGITRLELLGFRSSQDSAHTLRTNRPTSEDLSGVDLELSYERDGRTLTETFTIGLANVR